MQFREGCLEQVMPKSRSKDRLGAGLEKNASSTEVKGAFQFGWKVGMRLEEASEATDEMGELGRHQDTRSTEARAAQTGVCKSPGSLLACEF